MNSKNNRWPIDANAPQPKVAKPIFVIKYPVKYDWNYVQKMINQVKYWSGNNEYYTFHVPGIDAEFVFECYNLENTMQTDFISFKNYIENAVKTVSGERDC